MTNDWVYDIESRVFTIVKGKTEKTVRNKFPTVKYTTSDTSDQSAVFPTIYIHELNSPEDGRDLECDTVNSIFCTFEVKVTVDSKREDSKWIAKQITEAFRELKFHTLMFPITTGHNATFETIMRVRRMISNNDTL